MGSDYQLSAKIIGAEELKTAINSIDQVAIKAIVDAVNITAQDFENKARSYAPHKTGTLWNSIHAEPAEVSSNNVSAKVGTNLKYARAQEFGTVGMVINSHSKLGKPFTYIGNIKPKLYFAKAKDAIRTEFTNNLARAMQIIVSHLATKPTNL